MTEPNPTVDRDPMAVAIADAFRAVRKTGGSIDDAADVIAGEIRDLIAREGSSDQIDVVHVQSILTAATKDPAVQVRTNGSTAWQWSPAKAREHALAVLEVAEGAVHDAALYRMLTLQQNAPNHVALATLLAMRRFRGDVDREDWTGR